MRLRHAAWGLIVVCAVGSAPAMDDVTLQDLAWIAGAWSGKKGNMVTEEHWTAPRGGMMLGLHRDVMVSGKAAFEYLRIEQEIDGIFYLASPQGREATPFRLVEVGERRAVFTNPDHDFPQRITYWIEDGELCARIEGESNGRRRTLDWRWQRTSLSK